MTTHSDAWDDVEFARHRALLRRLRSERGWSTDAQWDDLDTKKQLRGLDQLIEERRQQHDL